MLIIEIMPSFIASSYLLLEQKGKEWLLTFGKKAFAYQDEAAAEWMVKVKDNEGACNLYRLADRVVKEARVDSRFVLDGVRVTCHLSGAGMDSNYTFASPEAQTAEALLMKTVLMFAERCIGDNQAFINYIELLEGYFSESLPVKIFDESPLRIKFYGSFSSLQQRELEQVIEKALQQPGLLIDMTNFQGMGTLLYGCFKRLSGVKNIHFVANAEAKRHLLAMGFGEELIRLVSL
ncbi:hypothetical protein [Taibaiella helva]|uniref:hypothetical protein n=1 Tax=Taibaiella helva TaxID=2301235 RepID=UPI000E569F25|nr:hypothetical protein [Taibaiella helva]